MHKRAVLTWRSLIFPLAMGFLLAGSDLPPIFLTILGMLTGISGGWLVYRDLIRREDADEAQRSLYVYGLSGFAFLIVWFVNILQITDSLWDRITVFLYPTLALFPLTACYLIRRWLQTLSLPEWK